MAPGKNGRALRILSIDGGGIRGIIPATVLAKIEDMTKTPTAALFDVIAGTSTGGILALGLTCPGPGGRPKHSATDLVRMYVDNGAAIFRKNFLTEGEKVIHEKYGAGPLERVLREYLGDTRLREAVTRVTVTSYETERRQPFFFRSVNATRDPAQYDYYMRDVARATSAAPTYFEPHKISTAGSAGYYSLVDGGVFANNPGMCAYVDALDEIDPTQNVLMVSLGTGTLTRPLHFDAIKHWGELEWVQPVINMMMDGPSNATDYQLARILGEGNYYRLQTTLDRANDEMDDASEANIRDLQLQSEYLIDQSEDSLAEIGRRLG